MSEPRHERHTALERWADSGVGHGYEGPIQQAGHGNYAFRSGGRTVGQWDSTAGVGHIEIPESPPAQEPVIPEPDAAPEETSSGQPESNQQV